MKIVMQSIESATEIQLVTNVGYEILIRADDGSACLNVE